MTSIVAKDGRVEGYSYPLNDDYSAYCIILERDEDDYSSESLRKALKEARKVLKGRTMPMSVQVSRIDGGDVRIIIAGHDLPKYEGPSF